MEHVKAMIQAVQSQGIVKLLEAQVNASLTSIAKAAAKKGNTPSWQINNPVNDAIENLINAGGIINRLGSTEVKKLDVNDVVQAMGNDLKKTESVVESKLDTLINLVNKQEVRLQAIEAQPPS